jgi:hypothetical protein
VPVFGACIVSIVVAGSDLTRSGTQTAGAAGGDGKSGTGGRSKGLAPRHWRSKSAGKNEPVAQPVVEAVDPSAAEPSATAQRSATLPDDDCEAPPASAGAGEGGAASLDFGSSDTGAATAALGISATGPGPAGARGINGCAAGPGASVDTRVARVVPLPGTLCDVSRSAVARRGSPDNDSIVIAVANAGPRTRVHVFASHFVPTVSPFDQFRQSYVALAQARCKLWEGRVIVLPDGWVFDFSADKYKYIYIYIYIYPSTRMPSRTSMPRQQRLWRAVRCPALCLRAGEPGSFLAGFGATRHNGRR